MLPYASDAWHIITGFNVGPLEYDLDCFGPILSWVMFPKISLSSTSWQVALEFSSQNSVFKRIKTSAPRAGKMAQWLIALVTIPWDPNSIPSSTGCSQLSVTPVSKHLMPSGFCIQCMHILDRQTDGHTHTHTQAKQSYMIDWFKKLKKTKHLYSLGGSSQFLSPEMSSRNLPYSFNVLGFFVVAVLFSAAPFSLAPILHKLQNFSSMLFCLQLSL